MGWKAIQPAFWSAALVAALAATAQSPVHEPAPLGKMVDLGGYRIHLYCTGVGKQTVVLSPGGGDFSFAWYLVQERLQSSARVCSYDRAGSAWSDPGPQPLTLRQEAYELESALKLSGEKGPYILVGHSIGGLVVRTFADGYPDESSGMVLVDAPSPDATMGYYGTLVRVRDLAKRTIPPVQTMKTSPPIPISDAERAQALKYKSHKIHPPFDRLPPEIQKLQLWAQMLPPGVAQTEENDYTPEEWQFLYERQQFGYPLGNKPLITMIGMKEAEDRPTSMSVLQDPTLGAVIEAYTREEMPERPKSRQSYSLLIRRHIQPKWGSNVLSEIRPHAVEVWLREMPYSPETKRHIKSMLYRLFELAMKRDWLEAQRNPMSLVRVKGRNRVVEKVVLTPEQMLMVRQNLDDPYLLMSELTCYLGLRICEVLGLMWGDFDPVEKTLSIRRSAVDGHVADVKSEASRDVIPLSGDFISFLLRWQRIAPHSDEGWMFPSIVTGRPYHAGILLRRHLKPLAAKIGVPRLGWHTFRHTFRSWLDAVGTAVGVQQKMMRHADVATTMNVYGKAMMDSKLDAHTKLLEYAGVGLRVSRL